MIVCVDRKEVFKYIDDFISELINFQPNTTDEHIAKASAIKTLSMIEERVFSMNEIYVDLEKNIVKR